MPRSKGRAGRPWRRARKRALEIPICWICGGEINLALPPNHRLAATVDHFVPLSKGGAELDPANLRPAHRACNSSRGNRTDYVPERRSRRW
ncbi:MAG: HNH endonuclease signature motif containing protein [Sphaerobacter sp.]|nr:HNH endonuclease signature motif containing protein [Sphaerobacter sp.]